MSDHMIASRVGIAHPAEEIKDQAMPHLVIEFSREQASDDQVETMLDAVHRSAADTDLFDESHIRVRAHPVDYFRMGGKRDHFIHCQCRIHTGRGEAQKRRLSEAVLSALREQQWPARTITVEVVDMDQSTYAKYSPN
jgi:5-carboxymethyl-2-hydroxymuconate isomerase